GMGNFFSKAETSRCRDGDGWSWELWISAMYVCVWTPRWEIDVGDGQAGWDLHCGCGER
ncbi:hypothetical protein COCCADRAFT_100100, partial [Bipolaris zeicola 26-R-13]